MRRGARKLLSHGVKGAARVAVVDVGNEPGDNEFGQCEHNCEIHGAPNLGPKQRWAVSCAERQEKIVDDRKGHQNPQKTALAPMQFLKTRACICLLYTSPSPRD